MLVKYLSYEHIEEGTQQVLKTYGYESTLPIPIERHIDNILQINVVPFPNLFKGFEINAFTSSDLKTIYVDEYLYTNLEPQYRFTLAHEFGHITLHRYIYDQVKIRGLEEWRRFMGEVDEKEYRKLEIQANNFAGLLLVPQVFLDQHFILQMRSLGKRFKRAEMQKLRRDDYLELTMDLIAQKLAPFFVVDPQVIKIRLEKSQLASKIP